MESEEELVEKRLRQVKTQLINRAKSTNFSDNIATKFKEASIIRDQYNKYQRAGQWENAFYCLQLYIACCLEGKLHQLSNNLNVKYAERSDKVLKQLICVEDELNECVANMRRHIELQIRNGMRFPDIVDVPDNPCDSSGKNGGEKDLKESRGDIESEKNNGGPCSSLSLSLEQLLPEAPRVPINFDATKHHIDSDLLDDLDESDSEPDGGVFEGVVVANSGDAKSSVKNSAENELSTCSGSTNTLAPQPQARTGSTNTLAPQPQAHSGLSNTLAPQPQAHSGLSNTLAPQPQAHTGLSNTLAPQPQAHTGSPNTMAPQSPANYTPLTPNPSQSYPSQVVTNSVPPNVIANPSSGLNDLSFHNSTSTSMRGGETSGDSVTPTTGYIPSSSQKYPGAETTELKSESRNNAVVKPNHVALHTVTKPNGQHVAANSSTMHGRPLPPAPPPAISSRHHGNRLSTENTGWSLEEPQPQSDERNGHKPITANFSPKSSDSPPSPPIPHSPVVQNKSKTVHSQNWQPTPPQPPYAENNNRTEQTKIRQPTPPPPPYSAENNNLTEQTKIRQPTPPPPPYSAENNNRTEQTKIRQPTPPPPPYSAENNNRTEQAKIRQPTPPPPPYSAVARPSRLVEPPTLDKIPASADTVDETPTSSKSETSLDATEYTAAPTPAVPSSDAGDQQPPASIPDVPVLTQVMPPLFRKGQLVRYHRKSDGMQRLGKVVGVHDDDAINGFYYTVEFSNGQVTQTEAKNLTTMKLSSAPPKHTRR